MYNILVNPKKEGEIFMVTQIVSNEKDPPQNEGGDSKE